jgi:glycosyltransferase involved in cell wall biosynthesis
MNCEPPAVSVILPVYNSEHLVGETIQRALAQTLPPLEIVVADDGSTDGTARVVAELAATSTVPIVYHYQPNQGPPSARNAAIRLARGSLLALLDADDLWLATKLARQVALLAEQPDLGLVACHVQTVLVGGRDWPAVFKQDYWEANPPTYTSSALLIRRAIWEQVGPFNPQRRLNDDADWVMRARDLGVPSAVVPEVLFIKRLHDQNISYETSGWQSDVLGALRQSLKRKH